MLNIGKSRQPKSVTGHPISLDLLPAQNQTGRQG
jgi:hypothetical protein